MRKNRSKALLSLALVLALLLSAVPMPAFAVTQDEIDALKAQRNEITAQREEKQAVVDQLESEHAGVLERKLAMDERNMYTIQQIELNAQEIALYDNMIAEKGKELDKAIELEHAQLEKYRSRVRAMEENGNYNLLAMVLKTTTLGELLTAIDDIGEIMESDRELEDEYIAARENTEAVKADYEATKTELEGKQAVLRAEQEELEKDIEEAIQLILSLEEDIANRQAEYDAILAAEDAANARIDELVAELERQRAAERAAAAAAAAANGGGGYSGGGGVTGSGSFSWPCPSSTYITSRFGPRTHPITGAYKNHTGLDIAANSGANILAADGGTVILAEVNGGYGNCVMIDHGNGYITLYGHMSGYACSEGQSVSKGDVIGYVGSTGMSTGPHLHFEVRSGGERIDPEQFFGGLTFSPDAGV